jgi:small-conductance mechanosensitive channel
VRKRQFLILILSLAALWALPLTGWGPALAFQDEPATPEPAEPAQPTPEGDQNPEPTPEATDILEGVIVTRTPEPTATPGRTEQQVENLVESVGLGQAAFLGVSVVNWLNLAISLLMVLAGYLAGTWLIRAFLPRIVRRTQTTFDDQSLAKIANDIRRLVVFLALQVATSRLTFVRAGLKAFFGDVYFVIGLFLAVLIAFRLIALADDWARRRSMAKDHNVELLEGVTVLLTRVGRVVVAILGLMFLLAYFGVDVTALAAALGLGGLAITLAAQDTIADIIAGVIILVDRPFRVGDRIEIQGANTWGDVLDIGLRTTRIRTRDNRVIILPNSTISSHQVTNYSYPDPSYRSETHLSVGSAADLETVRRLIVETIAGIGGVLTDKPIDALYIEMGDYGAIFRVRWWIETYMNRTLILDQVHTALQVAFDEAGIPFASTTRNVRLQADAGTMQRISSAFQGHGRTGHGAKTDA